MRLLEKIKDLWHRIRRCFGTKPQSPPPDCDEQGILPGKNDDDNTLAPELQEQGGVCEKNESGGSGAEGPEEMPRPQEPMDIGGKRKGGLTKKKGRRRGQNTFPSGPSTLSVKPELVCRKVGGRWGFFLNAPESCAISEVRQGEEVLLKKGDDFCLPSFAGGVVAQSASGDKSVFISCFHDDSPPIFKLRGIGDDIGRQVGKISRGDYVVMAPKGWRRIGDADIEPEPCADPNFTAHFFFADGGGAGGGFDEYALPCGKSEFELQGREIYDSHSHKIPLFVGPKPPILKTESGVRRIRVGDEGCGGWRGDNYGRDKSLPDILAEKGKRRGWFFVRVFGDDGKLMDSGSFRYCADLQKILVNGAEFGTQTLIMPGVEGHKETDIRIIGADENIRIKSTTSPAFLREDGAVVVPPAPQSDIKITLAPQGQGGVGIWIIPPLVWWRITKDGDSPGKWHDTPMKMTHAKFGDYAAAGAVIDILVPPEIESMSAGFNGKCDRALRKNSNTSPATWQLPLSSFADYKELEKATSAHLLHIQCGGKMTAVVCILASPMPTDDAPTAEKKSHPVRRRGNKRFSRGELRAAGLTKAQIRKMGVRIDKRRRTAHRDNVNALAAKKESNAESE